MPARRRERIRSTLRRESRGLAPSRVQRVVCDLPARRPLFVCQASGLIAHDASESNPPPGCPAFRRDVLGGFEQEATERTEEGRRHDFRYLCVLLFLLGSGVVCNLFARRVESMADIAATRERGERVPAQAGAVSSRQHGATHPTTGPRGGPDASAAARAAWSLGRNRHGFQTSIIIPGNAPTAPGREGTGLRPRACPIPQR